LCWMEEDFKYREEKELSWFSEEDKFLASLHSINLNGERFIKAVDDLVEDFIRLVNKIMERNNLQAETITEIKVMLGLLKDKINLLDKDVDYNLGKLTLQYELKRKTINE
jgi:hypothetical protein